MTGKEIILKDTKKEELPSVCEMEQGEARKFIILALDPDEIRQWKQSAGKNMMVGGASLDSSFMQQGLVDEVHQYILPLLLGGSKPMFPVDKKLELEFLESQTFPGDVVMLKYRL